jgi:hypothetical protein
MLYQHFVKLYMDYLDLLGLCIAAILAAIAAEAKGFQYQELTLEQQIKQIFQF